MASAAAPIYLPVFPLPDLTFFPGTLLPLHVFEPRYRAMVTDAMARDRRLAVAGLRPGYQADYHGRPPVFAVAGMGRIVRCERLATGRFDIVVRGEARVRLEREMPSDTLYRIAAAAPLAETGEDRPGVSPLAARVRRQCLRILGALGRPTGELSAALDGIGRAGELCDRVASAVVPDARVRQALLEELDVERRLRGLARALDGLLEHLAGDR
jgi:Lon protease-like protein